MLHFSTLLAFVLLAANIVSADYWRFTLDKYHCTEPREWNADNVTFRMTMFTDGGQNITVKRNYTSSVPRGATSDNQVMWKDIELNQNDNNLAVAFAAWNMGDEDPQDVGFTIAQLVLKVLRGNFVVSVIKIALDYVIDQFKDAYHCQGPVILGIPTYSAQTLRNMPIGQPVCQNYTYAYTTGPGCWKNEPFNFAGKNSSYWAIHCIQRFSGSSIEQGEINNKYSMANTNRRAWSGYGIYALAAVTIALSMSML